MATGDKYNDVGTDFLLASGAGATFDQTGMDALTFKAVGGVVAYPEEGDTYADNTETAINQAYTDHWNTAADAGMVVVTCEYIEGDAGQALILANKGSNAKFTWQAVDTDGVARFRTVRIGSVMWREKTRESKKGFTFELKRISAELSGTEVAAS